MKRSLMIFSVLLVLAALLTGCSAGLTEETLVGDWFCQLGLDGGLLENEYDFILDADGSYKFTDRYYALGLPDLNNGGTEYGEWAYVDDTKTLTFTPDSGDAYSFEIQTLVYPKTRLYWTDLNDKLETISGVENGSDGVFTFNLYEE